MKKAKISNLNREEWKYIFDNCIYYLNEDGCCECETFERKWRE